MSYAQQDSGAHFEARVEARRAASCSRGLLVPAERAQTVIESAGMAIA